MNEVMRTAYLEAMGVDSYISRAQLPGAAASQRLAIVDSSPSTPAKVASTIQAAIAPPLDLKQSQAELGGRVAATRAPAQDAAVAHAPPNTSASNVPRFSLAAVVVGDWLWLEALGNMPLATDQVWLIKAMTKAMNIVEARQNPEKFAQLQVDNAPQDTVRPDIAEFKWPIHNNQQLDQSIEAARASVGGFVQRKLQQHQCRGVVLLGKACEEWVPKEQFDVPVATTVSSNAILGQPKLKQQAWKDLRTLLANR